MNILSRAKRWTYSPHLTKTKNKINVETHIFPGAAGAAVSQGVAVGYTVPRCGTAHQEAERTEEPTRREQP